MLCSTSYHSFHLSCKLVIPDEYHVIPFEPVFSSVLSIVPLYNGLPKMLYKHTHAWQAKLGHNHR